MKQTGVIELVVVAILISIGCSSTKEMNHFTNGTYENHETGKLLELHGDGTYSFKYSDRRMQFVKVWVLQDLGFGSWRVEDGFLVLNSAAEIQSSVLRADVRESMIDSGHLKIDIDSPFDEYTGITDFHGHRSTHTNKLFRYIVEVYSDHAYFDKEIEIVNSTNVQLDIKDEFIVREIVIYIIPNPYLYPGKIAFNKLTVRYNVKNQRANHFTFNIPDFTMDYIGYVRHTEEYVKIIDEKRIKLRGEIYTRVW